MGGGRLLRTDCEVSHSHQKRCGERSRGSLALQPPPSLPATPQGTSQEHVGVPSISPNSSMENQKN